LSEAIYDAKPTKCVAEIWSLGRADPSRALVSPAGFKAALGEWDERREDFHWPMKACTAALEYHRSTQQDAVQFEWERVIASIDGSSGNTTVQHNKMRSNSSGKE
jgi:hypothetical protein